MPSSFGRRGTTSSAAPSSRKIVTGLRRFGGAARIAERIPMPVKDAQKQMRRHEHHDHRVAYRAMFVARRRLPIPSYEVAHSRTPAAANRHPGAGCKELGVG